MIVVVMMNMMVIFLLFVFDGRTSTAEYASQHCAQWHVFALSNYS
jgi:hypothetical protein